MPLSPRVHAQLKRYVNARLKAIALSKTNFERGISFPKSFFSHLHTIRRGYVYKRNIVDYNKGLINNKVSSLQDLLNEQRLRLGKRKIRFLDVCAGLGNLKTYFDELNAVGGNILYHGVDINPNPKNKVSRLNPVIDRLPRRAYDLIVSMYGFLYFPDMLHALENTINSLSVGGKLVIVGMGGIYLDGGIMKPSQIFEELGKKNKHLDIQIGSYDSVSIVKREEKPFDSPFRFVKATYPNADHFDTEYNLDNRIGVSSICKNYYVSDSTNKSKW